MYCEMCFEEELKKPLIDNIGNVFCSKKCQLEFYKNREVVWMKDNEIILKALEEYEEAHYMSECMLWQNQINKLI